MGLRPLKKLLALTFAFAAIVPILIVSFLVINHLAVDSIQEIEKKNLLLAEAMSGQVEVYLREPLVVLQNVKHMLKGNPEYSDKEILQLLELHVKGSKLFVKLDSPALKNELSYSKSKLIEELNKVVGEEIVKDIVFS